MGCCDTKTEHKKNGLDFTCPRCEDKGVKVQVITPQTLLQKRYQQKVNEDIQYKFCKNSECDVAYFSIDKSHFFVKEELSIKATLKDKGLDVNVCYCFDHTRQSILDEFTETGNTQVLSDIKEKMKTPGCFCEKSNPQGGCCLANVSAWVKEIT